ncbi:MAG: GFA family protein [Xanthomonadales bacterium]|nr:GFA family protein [Xanthomonadales bacterium]
MSRSVPNLATHRGGCHCGAVRFEFEGPRDVTVHACNCSICEMLGYQHLIVPAARFKLLHGEDALTEYRFNSEVARHLFCSRCGVKSFYIPRSNPDGYAVNFRCVDPATFDRFQIEPFDGQNWEQHAGALADLARTDQ